MIKNYADIKTPTTSETWIKFDNQSRIDLVMCEIKKINSYQDFEIISVPDNGQIVFKIERSIPSNKRGLLLLQLEEILKSSIDQGITVWCEPVGDKSKLRNLRGITINS